MKLHTLFLGIAGSMLIVGFFSGPAVAVPKHPSHKIVCSCVCSIQEDGEPIGNVFTYAVPVAGCSSLDDVKCTSADTQGKLKSCEKESVETGKVTSPILGTDLTFPELVAVVVVVSAILVVAGFVLLRLKRRTASSVES